MARHNVYFYCPSGPLHNGGEQAVPLCGSGGVLEVSDVRSWKWHREGKPLQDGELPRGARGERLRFRGLGLGQGPGTPQASLSQADSCQRRGLWAEGPGDAREGPHPDPWLAGVPRPGDPPSTLATDCVHRDRQEEARWPLTPPSPAFVLCGPQPRSHTRCPWGHTGTKAWEGWPPPCTGRDPSPLLLGPWEGLAMGLGEDGSGLWHGGSTAVGASRAVGAAGVLGGAGTQRARPGGGPTGKLSTVSGAHHSMKLPCSPPHGLSLPAPSPSTKALGLSQSPASVPSRWLWGSPAPGTPGLAQPPPTA